MALKLIIGNKNYSSWSLRPWMALKVAGIPFEEQLIPFETEDFKRIALSLSGTAKVPILIDGDVVLWESLAILEYLAEKFPAAGLWPKDKAARAQARVVANEMHAGFQAMRNELPVNFARRVIKRDLSPAVTANVRRIEALWVDCRTRFGAKAERGGPFLFGAFGNADAMYVPVVSRFHTYGVDVNPAARAYMDAVMALPAFKAWEAAGIAEPWLFAEDEVDWPVVHRADAK
ncbi:MAG: glutathione S-transferase family protein [Proteobacteria bacterium]|nr:glutathione S-transferase family protein [Pseudomonadota bacterium]